jgi:hypothetical protein
MTVARELTPDEVSYLSELLTRHLGSIFDAKAKMVPGSLNDQRAQVAESAVGWMCGFLQEQIRRRANEFESLIAGDLDAELRDLLDDEGSA